MLRFKVKMLDHLKPHAPHKMGGGGLLSGLLVFTNIYANLHTEGGGHNGGDNWGKMWVKQRRMAHTSTRPKKHPKISVWG